MDEDFDGIESARLSRPMKNHALYCFIAFIASVLSAKAVIIPDTNIGHCTIMSGTWSTPWTHPEPYIETGYVYGPQKGGINSSFAIEFGGVNQLIIAMMVDGGPTFYNPLYGSWILDHVNEPNKSVSIATEYWLLHWDAKYTPVNATDGTWSGHYYVALSDQYCAALPEGGPKVASLFTLFAGALIRRRR